jgi:predicted RNA-binding protein
VYIASGERQEAVMQNVAYLEAEDDGYVMIDLFGTKKFVSGRIKCLDLVDEHSVLMETIAL